MLQKFQKFKRFKSMTWFLAIQSLMQMMWCPFKHYGVQCSSTSETRPPSWQFLPKMKGRTITSAIQMKCKLVFLSAGIYAKAGWAAVYALPGLHRQLINSKRPFSAVRQSLNMFDNLVMKPDKLSMHTQKTSQQFYRTTEHTCSRCIF